MRTTTAIQTPRLSERVIQMKQSFMELHRQGFSIPDIAKKFNIDNSTIYYHLQDIAEANGMAREDLLRVVKTNSRTYLHREENVFRVDSNKLIHDLANAKISISEAKQKIDGIITNYKENEK